MTRQLLDRWNLESFFRRQSTAAGQWSDRSIILLSIVVLLETIRILSLVAFREQPIHAQSGAPFTRELRRLLAPRGWCPRRNSLYDTSLLNLYTLYLAPPKASLLDPTVSNNHEECSSLHCWVSDNIIVPTHRGWDGPCRSIAVDLPGLEAIIQAGRIPVIPLKDLRLQKSVVRVQPWTAYTRVLAVSYVW